MTELPVCDISVDDRITSMWHFSGWQNYQYVTFQWMTKLPVCDISVDDRITSMWHFSGWQNYRYVTFQWMTITSKWHFNGWQNCQCVIFQRTTELPLCDISLDDRITTMWHFSKWQQNYQYVTAVTNWRDRLRSCQRAHDSFNPAPQPWKHLRCVESLCHSRR